MATSSLFSPANQTFPGQQTYGQIGPSSNPQGGNNYQSFLQWQMDTYGPNSQLVKSQQKTAQANGTAPQIAVTPPPPPPPSFMPNGAPPVSGDPARLPPTLGAGLPTEVAGLQKDTVSAIQKAINNPTVSPEEIAQLKGKSKDQAALLGQQNMGAFRQSLAQRGINPNSQGYAASKQFALRNAIGSDLLSNYRDIDLNALNTNRNNLFQAINTGAGVVNDETQRQNLFDQLALQYQQLNQRRLESLYQ